MTIRLLVACLVLAFGSHAAATEQRSVLLLLPGDPALPAAAALATGVRGAVVGAWSTGISIETEHPDLARFRDVADLDGLVALYRARHAGHTFEAIIAAGNEPLAVALRLRDDLWPRTPLIACAVDERTVPGFKPPRGVTLVTVRYDAEGTIRAALALKPDTRSVALVGGASADESRLHDLARQAVRTIGGGLELIDLTGLPMDDALLGLARLPEHTIVLVSSFQIDGAGRRFRGTEIIGPLTAAANRPVFSMFGTVVGLGIVGGSVTDFEAVGREAGALALRALRGEPLPSALVSSTAPSVLRFDGRQLDRWALDERRLPGGSAVLYRNPSLWQQYRWHTAGVLAVVLVQAVLIAGLLLERRHRRRMQVGLAEHVDFETLTAQISRTFASVPAVLLDEEVRDCLRRVVVFLGVDRGTIWQPSADRQTLVVTHGWTAAAAQPPPPVVVRSRFPVLWQLAERQAGLWIARPEDIPSEAAAERAALEELGIRSLAGIPLKIGARGLGILVLVTLRRERTWPDEVIRQIRTLGELFANALMRKETATALADKEAFTGAVLAALPGETAIIDAKGVIVQMNEAWGAHERSADTGAPGAISMGANYLDACRSAIGIPANVAPKALVLLEAVLEGRTEEVALEYPAVRDGRDCWMEMHVRRLERPGGGAAVMHFDVTARKRAEAAAQRHLSDLAHLDRVAGMGELTTSIAHELNQPLTAILANVRAAQRFLAEPRLNLDEARACLEDIASDDRRAGEVIRRMRQLLKKGDFKALPIELNDLTRNTIALVTNDALLHYVSIEFRPAAVLPETHGDLVQIQQVILNLLANAITAAAGGPTPSRKIVVWTATVEPGGIELGVHDSGKGIAERDLQRLFEPFFTTKEHGLGMGLGISRSIVEAHGGRILVDNDPAGGATFRLQLPAAKAG
jgi:signal transduction histidine kinase/PAS domain-containing protein